MKVHHAGQSHNSNPRNDSNGKYGSNGHIVGPEENADKTLEVNFTSKLVEVVDVSSKSNTCLMEMTQECDRSNGPRLLLIGQGSEIGGKSDGPVGLADGQENGPFGLTEGQEKGLTKHGRGKSGRSKKHKKLKALSVGLFQPKPKQPSSRSLGGGKHGKATNRNLGLVRSDSKGSLVDYPFSSSGDLGGEVLNHGPASSPGGKETCLENLPGCFENVGLLRIKQMEVPDFEGKEAGTDGSVSREGSYGMELDMAGDVAASH